jgi:hypothetical protein
MVDWSTDRPTDLVEEIHEVVVSIAQPSGTVHQHATPKIEWKRKVSTVRTVKGRKEGQCGDVKEREREINETKDNS